MNKALTAPYIFNLSLAYNYLELILRRKYEIKMCKIEPLHVGIANN